MPYGRGKAGTASTLQVDPHFDSKWQGDLSVHALATLIHMSIILGENLEWPLLRMFCTSDWAYNWVDGHHVSPHCCEQDILLPASRRNKWKEEGNPKGIDDWGGRGYYSSHCMCEELKSRWGDERIWKWWKCWQRLGRIGSEQDKVSALKLLEASLCPIRTQEVDSEHSQPTRTAYYPSRPSNIVLHHWCPHGPQGLQHHHPHGSWICHSFH